MISLNPKKEKKLKEFSNSKKLITRKVRFKKIEEIKSGPGRRPSIKVCNERKKFVRNNSALSTGSLY